MARWRPRIRNGAPDTPSNPRRLTTDPCNKVYGSSKILAELIAEDYRKHRNMNVITLRPRGFIPYWDHDVYASYSDWARWFWKGAVPIDEVAAAVIRTLDLFPRT